MRTRFSGTRMRGRNGFRLLLCAISLLWSAQAVEAYSGLRDLAARVGVRVLAEGEAGDQALTTAVRELPYQQLNADGRKRIDAILKNCSQHRRLPTLQYVVDPPIYRYLVRHPDVAVSTWRVMKISGLQMWQTDALEFEVMATDGSEGVTDIMYMDDKKCLFMCEGSYRSALLPKEIQASAMLLLQYEFVKARDGSTLVNQKLDTFICLPSETAQAVARLASPLTNVIMDRNLFEVSLYGRMMSKASLTEPEWLEQMAERLEGVLPQRRTELRQLARASASRLSGTQSPRDMPEASSSPEHPSQQFRIFESSLSRVQTMMPVPEVPATSSSTPLHVPASDAPQTLMIVPAARTPTAEDESGNITPAGDQSTPMDGPHNKVSRTAGTSTSQSVENNTADSSGAAGPRAESTDLFELQPDVHPPSTFSGSQSVQRAAAERALGQSGSAAAE